MTSLQKRTPEGEDGESQLFACPNCTARFQTDQQLQEHRYGCDWAVTQLNVQVEINPKGLFHRTRLDEEHR